ncbi:TonB-dependent receptor [Marinimicrobium agarilyticum]|uniref:TonB-dependent receptor n=1 Tax=Marinimicrobium agarilyticum TaxID=306546 RepID=UPI001FE14B6A|nr:TonB-dependent receptor [Marinimicrobium agarilyticum]
MKRSYLSRSIAATLAFASTPALTQSFPDEPLLEEIVVTGIRASLNKAISIKRDSMHVMDSIVAEDIGKLPDNNVVESLQRVSGVQVTDRGAGEANAVSIRGLTDISTTINGRTVFISAGRAVALADMPSTLVSRVDVIKNRGAEHYENGIAGLIDVHTFQPFDFDGAHVSVSARGVYMEESEKTNPNISALFSNRWSSEAGEFGALLNVSYARTESRDQLVTAGAQVPFMSENPVAPYVALERIFLDHPDVSESPIWASGLEQGLPTEAGSTLSINGEEAEYYLSRDAFILNDITGDRERPAANLSLQFAPNDSSEYTFEAFYNGYRNEGLNSQMFSYVDSWWALGSSPEETFETYEGTNIIKSRTVGANGTFGSGDYTKSETDSFLYALGGDWQLADDVYLESEVVYQKSEYDTHFVAMRNDTARYMTSVNFDGIPGIEFADDPATESVDEGNLADASQYTMGVMYDNAAKDQGSAVTFTTDGEYFLDNEVFTLVKFGVRYDDRDAEEFGYSQTGACAQPSQCSFDLYEGIAHINNDFFGGEADVPRSWMVADSAYIADNRSEFLGLYGLNPEQTLRQEFAVEEANLALYASSEFETRLAGLRLDGEIGLRYVDVQTDTQFHDSVSGDVTEATTDTDELLKTLALRYHLRQDVLLRLSYGETLRMPNFGDLNPTITYLDDTTNVGYGTATSGNANLQPTSSQNIDLSLEWYIGDASSAYLTWFERDIEGLVVSYRSVLERDLDGFEADTFVLTRPENAGEGTLSGVEIGFNYFPENLTGAWDGLGLQSSATFLDTEQVNPVVDTDGEITGYTESDMFGVSDESYSVTLAYERPSFDTRLSYVWRSDFLFTNDSGQFANPTGIYRDAQGSLDYQFSYNATDGLTFTFDATNLTGEVYQSRYGNSELHTASTWQISRTFALGARYTF